MNYSWHDVIGNIGVLLILAGYLFLQLGKLHPASLQFSLVNGLGAFLILFSLWFEFNLSAFVVEAAWLLISIFGIARYLRRNRAES
ncbi:MAG: hypothetical protein WBN32_13385 [Woeseia sp.]